MNTVFHEIKPSQDLLPFVQTYWQGNFNVSGEKNLSQSVLPNGCIELIIHITDAHCALTKGTSKRWARTPEFALLGLFEKPYEVHFETMVQVFGIRFYPDGFRNIFGVSPGTILATYEDGTEVLGRQLRSFCSGICTAPMEQHGRLANTFISRQLARNYRRHDYTHLAMKLIRQGRGLVDYQSLLHEIPISPRQLQREFRSLYGITIKDYIRISRMNAIHRYMKSPSVNLTQLPYELEFTDQSHFIREFKNYTSIAPRGFIKRREYFIVNPGE